MRVAPTSILSLRLFRLVGVLPTSSWLLLCLLLSSSASESSIEDSGVEDECKLWPTCCPRLFDAHWAALLLVIVRLALPIIHIRLPLA